MASWAKKHLGALQVCWLCIFAMVTLVFIANTRFAKANELQDVSADVSNVRLQLLQKDIIDTRVIQCTSVSGSKYWYENRIGDLQRTYAYLNPLHQTYPMPRCEDL